MGFIGNEKTWVPYLNKNFSQGFSVPPVEFHDDGYSPNFSLLVIAIIGILASAFLLVSYYTIIYKYCGKQNSTWRRENADPDIDEVLEEDDNPFAHEPWQISTTGLDEALIKSITFCKYKKGDGLIEGTECSVCLTEFREDESLRLLPKCSHAFHVHCIDTWLRSHSNCPLCRANIIFISASQLQLPAPVTENPPPGNESLQDGHPVTNENVTAAQESRRRSWQEVNRVQSDLGNVQGRDTVIEIREEGYQQMRRSVSMDHFRESQVSVADILHVYREEDSRVEECHVSSKQSAEAGKVSNKMRVLKYCVKNPVAMKRSFSSGRFFLSGQGRVRDPTIPL